MMEDEVKEFTQEQRSQLENLLSEVCPGEEVASRYAIVVESMDLGTGDRGLVMTHSPGMMTYEVQAFLNYEVEDEEEDD